jgi:hypothetical protein
MYGIEVKTGIHHFTAERAIPELLKVEKNLPDSQPTI